MFHSLKYSVSFPTTGRTLNQDLQFEKGFWAITGPNEVGKSFIFEMLRYMLFGSAALRGVADDYKSLTVAGSFSIREVRYSIERTPKKATLWRGDEVLATGVSTVNEKIVNLLGFGLLVFDMANSINQGEVERLGNLTPMERKRMVDSVLGLDLLEVVAKWGADEARERTNIYNTMVSMMVEPKLPVVPEGYVPCDQIDVDGPKAEADELMRLTGYLQAPGIALPVEPQCDVIMTVAELEPLALDQARQRANHARLRAELDALPVTATFTNDLLDQIEAAWVVYNYYLSAQTWLKNNPLPPHSLEICQQYSEAYAVLETQRKRESIEKQITQARAKGGCTGCGLPFAHDHIDELEAELKLYPLAVPSVDPTTIPLNVIEKGLREWPTYDMAQHDLMKSVEPASPPNLSLAEVPRYRAQIAQVARRAELEPQVEAAIPTGPDYEGMLAKRKAYEASLANYNSQVQAYNAWKAEYDRSKARAEQLSGAAQRYEAVRDLFAICNRYEEEMVRFQKAYDDYMASVEKAETIRVEAEQYRKVRQLMDILRSKVKQHVIPSLNKVASHLLRGMTGGQRQSLQVDEDFNVIVDQQRLDTLSGSGKACANLSLRIALGQVLTNRVMSVLLADEIDASMDDFRAQKTSDVLYTLENSIYQVLLVSHKSIDVPNVITLGVNNGNQLALEGGAN